MLSTQTEAGVNFKKELLEIPRALQQMYEKGRPFYDTAIRSVTWGERPIFMVGNNSSFLAALSGAWAFEYLPSLPVIVRHPAVFSAYTCRALAAHSLVMVVSASADDKETLQAAKNAKRHGAIVWAITASPASELAELADVVVNCYAGESSNSGSKSIFCLHAVMLFLAVAVARVLKPPSPRINVQEEELGKMAAHVEWVLHRISDAGSALGTTLGSLAELYIVGSGAFYPVALQTASCLRQLAGIHAFGFDLLDFQADFRRISWPGAGILYLSSSRSKLKDQVHQSVRDSRQKSGLKIFAITDSNDRQLSQRTDLAVLLPDLTEGGSALLALAFLELTATYSAQASAHGSARRQQPGRL